MSTKKNAEQNEVENSEPSTKNEKPMHQMMHDVKTPPTTGDLVEGKVIALDKGALYVDVFPFGTGIIYGREYINARDMVKKMNIGDDVSATVVMPVNDEGYIELSLKEARQAIVWSEAEAGIKTHSTFEVLVTDANKGGLILTWQGLPGFLPASQLKSEHYPRVEGGDKDKILEELRKLVGKTLPVSVIAADPKEGKLIFSEKGLDLKEKEKLVDHYQVGSVVEGEVTGVVDFGVFIKVEEGLEGLAHISELDWGLVEDPRKLFTVGQKLNAKIIEIKDGKISLSVKQLSENPWVAASEKYHKGDVVDAVVIKYNKHGALASVEEGVAGLVHISEFESPEKLRETLELGKLYKFTINLFEPREQRMTLSFKEEKK